MKVLVNFWIKKVVSTGMKQNGMLCTGGRGRGGGIRSARLHEQVGQKWLKHNTGISVAVNFKELEYSQ